MELYRHHEEYPKLNRLETQKTQEAAFGEPPFFDYMQQLLGSKVTMNLSHFQCILCL